MIILSDGAVAISKNIINLQKNLYIENQIYWNQYRRKISHVVYKLIKKYKNKSRIQERQIGKCEDNWKENS